MPAVASAAAPSRSTTTTLAPCLANAAAAALPMPLPPPVISATLPVKSIAFLRSSVFDVELSCPRALRQDFALPPTRHVERRAGDVARLVRGKIEHRIGDLARFADAAHRREFVGAEVAVAHL